MSDEQIREVTAPREAVFPHGENRGYVRGCRCSDCRAAHAAYARERRRVGLAPEDPRHGTFVGYWRGCRCDACRAANTEAVRVRAHRLGYHRPREVVNAERRVAAEARDNHGTETRYHLGCRCRACKDGAAEARRRRRTAAHGRGQLA